MVAIKLRITLKQVLLICLMGMAVNPAKAASPDLTQLSIEELMNMEVVSPAKQAQRLTDAASAVFVITQDDIRRSGVTNIPAALRLAPGVQVAQIDSNRWAVSIRGFNGRFSNKLLVLVDGRSIYTPTFAGVYWEFQNFLLEDIERIEVIRGPGASLWGANAVNGVINILTRRAAGTENLVSVTAGNEEKLIVGVRFSDQWGEDAHYRLYGKYINRDGLLDLQGRDAEDEWYLSSGGFRLDWTPSGRDSFSLQGDVYGGSLQQNTIVPALTPPYQQQAHDTTGDSGGDLQGNWRHVFSSTSNLDVKFYYQWERYSNALLGVDLDTFDLDLQHTFALNERHALLWGLEYRHHRDRYSATEVSTMVPAALDYDLFSAFLQDKIDLIPEVLEVTLGASLEHNDFTGWEFQPNARLLWEIHPQHRLWAAVSRAVRTPSRVDDSIRLNLFTLPPQTPENPLPVPILLTFQGNPAFGSEKLTAYEIGYRALLSEQLSLDVATFYNDYDDLRAIDIRSDLATVVENSYVQVPGLFVNASQGHTYGFEVAVNWQAAETWRLQGAYSYLRAHLRNQPGFSGVLPVVRDGSQPRHQLSLRSSFDIRHDLEFDLWLYYGDELSDLVVVEPTLISAVDDYVSVNARLGWRPRPDLELSLAGANLLGPPHVEFVQEIYPFPEQVERRIYGQMKWSF